MREPSLKNHLLATKLTILEPVGENPGYHIFIFDFVKQFFFHNFTDSDTAALNINHSIFWTRTCLSAQIPSVSLGISSVH